MKKEISHEDKLEFYKKFNDEKFVTYYNNISDKYDKIGLVSLKIFFSIALIGGIIIPWLFLCAIPAFIVPLSTLFLSHHKHKRAINKLSKNITYKDYIEMLESGEWLRLAKEANYDKITKKQKMVNSSVKEKPIIRTKSTAFDETYLESYDDRHHDIYL